MHWSKDALRLCLVHLDITFYFQVIHYLYFMYVRTHFGADLHCLLEQNTPNCMPWKGSHSPRGNMEGLYPLPKTITHTDSQNLTIWKTIGYPLPTRAIGALLSWSMCCQVEGRILQYSNAKPLQLGTALALTTHRESLPERKGKIQRPRVTL